MPILNAILTEYDALYKVFSQEAAQLSLSHIMGTDTH